VHRPAGFAVRRSAQQDGNLLPRDRFVNIGSENNAIAHFSINIIFDSHVMSHFGVNSRILISEA
jgi:hypothetical protein